VVQRHDVKLSKKALLQCQNHAAAMSKQSTAMSKQYYCNVKTQKTAMPKLNEQFHFGFIARGNTDMFPLATEKTFTTSSLRGSVHHSLSAFLQWFSGMMLN
jgi:hypothetical protein